MLILAPIDQTGWRKAVSGVARAISSVLARRNGPPDAVKMIFSSALRSLPASAWKMALCSESTGSRVAPASRTARSITSPAETMASLLASAMAPPRSAAAKVGARPATPVIAAMVQSAPRRAASSTASGPHAMRMPVPCSAAASVLCIAGSLQTASSARNAMACAASASAELLATRASTR